MELTVGRVVTLVWVKIVVRVDIELGKVLFELQYRVKVYQESDYIGGRVMYFNIRSLLMPNALSLVRSLLMGRRVFK